MAEASSPSNPPSYCPLPGGKSKVWKYFGFKVDKKGRILSQKEVFCLLEECKCRLPYTTNLFYHLRNNHPEDYGKIAPTTTSKTTPASSSANQTTLTSYIANTQPYSRSSPRFLAIEDELLTFLCKSMLPLSLVESAHFKNFLAALEPRYKPSSRAYYTKTKLPQKYEATKEIVKQELDNEAIHCSFTTDLLTGCHNRGYLSLTVHFVDTNMKMKHYCLMTKEADSAHTAENLVLVLNESLSEWNLDEKVYAFSTDNGQNMVNAVVHHLKVLHIPCISHTLQLSVQKSFNIDYIARVLAKIWKLVGHFRKSTKATYEF
uniref:DUF659 domain-containing protein n=1 Tax=Amphimedon queenslandica TaxID=400682 RepID=A0A1X7VYX5_AMPQE